MGADDLLEQEALRERERQYSPSSCIGGDYRPFVAAYRARSERARADAQALHGTWHDLRVGDAALPRVDLCVPPGAVGGAAAPLLVFIHGGYWQELSAADSLFAAADCVRHGIAFAAIDYTLAPAARIGSIVAECRAALLHLATHGARWRIDPARIVVAGSSAGAHLAAMACLAGWRAGTALRPLAAVLVSGVYTLSPLVGTSINQALGMDGVEAMAASPLMLPLDAFPPSIVTWGEVETDAFKAQSHAFADALAEAGSACERFEVPARNHFDVILELADEHTRLGRATLALLGAGSA